MDTGFWEAFPSGPRACWNSTVKYSMVWNGGVNWDIISYNVMYVSDLKLLKKFYGCIGSDAVVYY